MIKKPLKTIGSVVLVSATMALMGCAGTGAKDGTSADSTVSSYQQYLDKTPSFEVQSVGDADADLLLASVAEFAKNKHEAVLAINDAVEGNADGHKAFVALSELQGTERADYVAAMTPETKSAYGKYVDQMEKLSEIKADEKEAILAAAVAVVKIDKDSLLSGANMMQKVQLAKSLKTAVEQGAYARDSMAWMEQYQATLTNVQNDTGR